MLYIIMLYVIYIYINTVYEHVIGIIDTVYTHIISCFFHYIDISVYVCIYMCVF